jgi:hypothetical protein
MSVKNSPVTALKIKNQKPSGFGTTKIGDIHPAACIDLDMTPSCSSLSTSLPNNIMLVDIKMLMPWNAIFRRVINELYVTMLYI